MPNAFYLMSGQAHLHYLVPSLYTLRQHNPDVPVTVWAYPESYDLVDLICKDDRLKAVAIKWQPYEYKKNSQFINKIHVVMQQHFWGDGALYLDADTTIHGSLNQLFEHGKRHPFVATQFCHWTSNGKLIRQRLERMRGREGIPQDLLEQLLTNSYASLNGGVFLSNAATNRGFEVLDWWLSKTESVQDVFICDEMVLHLLQLRFNDVKVLEGGQYNASHKYTKHPNPIIYHYHGNSALRPGKSKAAYEMWWPIYQKCVAENVGFIQEWKDVVHNKWLDKVLKDSK